MEQETCDDMCEPIDRFGECDSCHEPDFVYPIMLPDGVKMYCRRCIDIYSDKLNQSFNVYEPLSKDKSIRKYKGFL